MAWFALRVRAAQEKRVRERILAVLTEEGLSDKVKQVLVPVQKVLREHKGRKKQNEQVFMAGYLFLEMAGDKVDRQVYEALRRVPDVMYFLSSGRGKEPIPIPDAEMHQILVRASDQVAVPDVAISLHPGDMVRVMEGPFSGFDGIVREVAPDKGKLQVHVKIFGRETPIELTYSQVEKL